MPDHVAAAEAVRRLEAWGFGRLIAALADPTAYTSGGRLIESRAAALAGMSRATFARRVLAARLVADGWGDD